MNFKPMDNSSNSCPFCLQSFKIDHELDVHLFSSGHLKYVLKIVQSIEPKSLKQIIECLRKDLDYFTEKPLTFSLPNPIGDRTAIVEGSITTSASHICEHCLTLYDTLDEVESCLNRHLYELEEVRKNDDGESDEPGSEEDDPLKNIEIKEEEVEEEKFAQAQNDNEDQGSNTEKQNDIVNLDSDSEDGYLEEPDIKEHKINQDQGLIQEETYIEQKFIEEKNDVNPIRKSIRAGTNPKRQYYEEEPEFIETKAENFNSSLDSSSIVFPCYDPQGYKKLPKKAKKCKTVGLYMCDYPECSTKSFVTPFLLKNHMDTVHIPYRFKCQVCNKKFKTKGQCKSHEKIHDTRPRNFPCEICSKSYRSKHELKQHYSQVHVPYQFECTECHQQFKTSYHLQTHFQSHGTNSSVS